MTTIAAAFHDLDAAVAEASRLRAELAAVKQEQAWERGVAQVFPQWQGGLR